MEPTYDVKRTVCKSLADVAYRVDINSLLAEVGRTGATLLQTWPAIDGGQGFEAFTATLRLSPSRDAVIFVFRGTKSETEWLAYLQALAGQALTPVEGLTVFTPFLDVLKYLWEQPGDQLNRYSSGTTIEIAILDALRGRKEVWLTGHSKGGAIAQTTAALLACGQESRQCDEHLPLLSVMTFNAPMALITENVMRYERTRTLYGIEHRRVEHRGDMIRFMPAGLGLDHGGCQEVYGEGLAENGGVAHATAKLFNVLSSTGSARPLASSSAPSVGHPRDPRYSGETYAARERDPVVPSKSVGSSVLSLASAVFKHATNAHRQY